MSKVSMFFESDIFLKHFFKKKYFCIIKPKCSSMETILSPNSHIRASVDYIRENMTNIVFSRTLHL